MSHRTTAGRHRGDPVVARVVSAAAVVAATAFVVPAWAGDGESDDQSDDEAVTVRTVDRAELQRDDERFASGMTTRVDTGGLAFRGRGLADALSRVTGVYVRREAGGGQAARPMIRGGNSRQMVVELDGVRLSSPTGAGFDAGGLMTGGIGSVDVARGAAAATRGSGAVSGAMQLNPVRVTEPGLRWDARAQAGSFGTAGTDAAVSVADSAAGARFHGGFERSRGDFEFVDDRGEGRQRVNNDHRRVGVGATGHLEQGEHRLRATGMFQSSRAGSPGPSEFQQAFAGARTTDRNGLATVRWDRRSLLDRPGLLVDARATAGARQRDYHYENDEGALTGVPFESRSTTRTAAGSTGLTALIADQHIARLDIDARTETHVGATRSVDDSRLEATRHTAGATLADEWLVADEAISLVGAVRAEYSRGDIRQLLEPFLPAVGAIVRAHPRVKLRANAARTFRLPHFDELYLETEHVRGNPDLAPERARVADAAVELGADDDPLWVQLAYFDHAIDSTILFLPVSARQFEARSIRGATSRGLEAAVHSRVAQRWELHVGYTYTRAYLRDDGTAGPPQLPGWPRHRLSVDSTLDLTGLSLWSELPELLLSSSLQYRSSLNFDHYGHLGADPSLRVDLGGSVGITSGFRLGVQVRNVLDEQWTRDSFQRPLPGRSLFGAVEFSGG